MKRFTVDVLVVVVAVILFASQAYGVPLFSHLGGPPGVFPIRIYLFRLLFVAILVSILIFPLIAIQKMRTDLWRYGVIRIFPVFKVVRGDGHLEPFRTAVHGTNRRLHEALYTLVPFPSGGLPSHRDIYLPLQVKIDPPGPRPRDQGGLHPRIAIKSGW